MIGPTKKQLDHMIALELYDLENLYSAIDVLNHNLETGMVMTENDAKTLSLIIANAAYNMELRHSMLDIWRKMAEMADDKKTETSDKVKGTSKYGERTQKGEIR